MLKATIFEIKRFAVHDGDGIRTTVFLQGCPLKCLWCHNPEGLSRTPRLAYYAHKCVGCGECAKVCPNGAHQTAGGIHRFDRSLCTACGACASVCLGDALLLYGKETTVEELLPLLLEDRDFYDSSGGGVTLSGGECLMQADFCAELLKRLKELGIHTAVDTCGLVPRSALDKVLPYTDVFLYDVKAAQSDTHRACTGCPNETVLENLRYLSDCGAPIEVRIPYVPEHNAKEIEKIALLLSEIKTLTRVRVLPYHNYAGSKYEALDLPNTLPQRLPSGEELQQARRIIQQHCNVPVGQ